MKDFEEIIARVSRPSRYIGGEVNSIRKDQERVRLRVALIFPDTYEIGMSHLGLHILYHVLNQVEWIQAERAYAPWVDMEQELRKARLPLASLETGTPLGRFDILGITLPYELCYTNVLTILDLAGVPLMASEREAGHPLVLGGGAAAANPEPLADFFDAFLLGDGEEAVLEIADVVRRWKEQGEGRRQELLSALREVPGVYVPNFFQPEYASSGAIQRISPAGSYVVRRILADLNSAAYPVRPLVPYMGTVHDRITLEVARGCTRGCRFCQAGVVYRPVRERRPERIVALLDEALRNSGYEEVSFASLSTGDYSCMEALAAVARHYGQQKVSISLPSLRPGTLEQKLLEEIKQMKKTGITLAPEAGTQRLRDVINKDLGEEEIFRTVEAVFRAGWEVLKLYFMIGLPTEREEDITGLIRLVEELRRLSRRVYTGRRPRFNISISPFVPKAHTPFQWCAQEAVEMLEEKQRYICSCLRRRDYALKLQNPKVSYLEGLLSRGDRRLGRVILRAWELGARFDSWTEEFDLGRWQKALADCGLDADWYVTRSRPEGEVFPWEHLHTGVSREFLWAEYQRGLRGETTPDCRRAGCQGCGVCREEITPRLCRPEDAVTVSFRPRRRLIPLRFRLRCRFTKEGRLRFLSQLELQRLLIRALRRIGAPLAYSQGFHPHPRLSFAAALPVGAASIAEYVDIELVRAISPEGLCQRLNQVLPEGIRFLAAKHIPLEARSLASVSQVFSFQVSAPVRLGSLAEAEDRIRRLWAEGDEELKRKVRRLEVHGFRDGRLEVELWLSAGARPKDIMQQVFGMSDEEWGKGLLVRTGIWYAREDELLSPLEV